jgi:hypothetical protein
VGFQDAFRRREPESLFTPRVPWGSGQLLGELALARNVMNEPKCTLDPINEDVSLCPQGRKDGAW